jgi:hypothetical protein
MPKVQLKIEVNDNAESEKLGDVTNQVNGEGSNANVSNVSIEATDTGIYVIGAMNKNGREMLSFGEDGNLVFNIDGFLSSNGVKAGALASEQDPDMFVWGVVPASKEYHVKLTFINAKNLREIVVYGDPVANQFPTEAIVNGITTIYSDDNRWAINLGSESTTHTIEFTKWNRADYNACLTLIKVMLRYFEIGNHTGLLDIESLSQSNAQPKEIMYGLVPSTGTARINVFDELRDLIEEGIITNNKNSVEIYVDGKKVQHHITTDSDYENNKVLTMDFENHLSFLDGVYAGRSLTDPMSAYSLLSEVLGTLNYTTKQIDSMLDKEIVYGNNESGSVKSYLENITIEYPYLESATYRETLDKFCVLAQLNLLEDDNGDLKFVSARPVEIKDTEIIAIPVNRQFSSFSKDEFLKNKYRNVFIGRNNYVGEYQLFGETKTVTFLEEKEDSLVGTLSDGSTYEYSDYKEVYNDKSQNIYADFTTKETRYVTGLVIEGYKVKGIKLPISREYIVKDSEILYLNVEMIVKNKATAINKEGKIENFITKWRGTRSRIFTWKLIDENKDGVNYSRVENIKFENDYVTFDLFCPSLVYADGSGDSAIASHVYPLSVNLQLYGNVYRIENVASEERFDIEISSNELITDKNQYKGVNLIKLNSDNIATDYGAGIRTSRVSVGCLNYYNTNGELAIDWDKRQMFKVGDIVRVDKDNNGNSIANYSNGEPYLWKVVGRNFRYSGVPMIDLELQEVKFNAYFVISEIAPNNVNVTYTRLTSEIGASIGIIDRATRLYKGDIIKVEVSTNEIYDVDTITINGESFANGGTISVKDNLNIEIKTKVRELTINSKIGEGATLVLSRESSPYGNATLGKVSVNDIFYYGDVLIIGWTLSGGAEVRDAYFNDIRLYQAGTNRVTITKNSTLIIPTKTVGWTTIWAGQFEYNMLENYGTDSEILLDLRDYLTGDISLQPNVPTQLYFEPIYCHYGDLSDYNSTSRFNGSRVYYAGDPLYAEDLSGATGEFGEMPEITIRVYDNGNNQKTSILKIQRTQGTYKPPYGTYQDCIFGEFKLVKIEQYI